MAEAPHLADDRLRGPGGGRTRGEHVANCCLDGGVQPGLALDHLVDEPDALRADRVEPTPAGEQGACVALADLRDDERRDHRREDAQPCLGEAETGAGLGDHQVRHCAQPHAAAERRPVNACDDRHRARVDRLEHVGHGHRVLFVAFDIELHRGAHPCDVGAGTERRPGPGQHNRPELGRALARERGKGRSKLGDDGSVERVVDLWPVERHPRHDP